MITDAMRASYDPENDASRVTYWDMALGNDVEQLHGMIRMLQVSVGNLQLENDRLRNSIRLLDGAIDDLTKAFDARLLLLETRAMLT